MRLLLDSHAVIWAVDDPTQLSAVAAAAIRTGLNDTFISAATVWEISIKVGQGKLSLSLPFRAWMNRAVVLLRAAILPISIDYADVQAALS